MGPVSIKWGSLPTVTIDTKRALGWMPSASAKYQVSKNLNLKFGYNKAIKQRQHHVLYLSLGNVYQRQGKLDEAIAAYKKSLELKPTFTHSLYELASAYVKKGQYEEAIEPLQKLLQIEPRHAFANHALGLAYIRTGDKTAAMQQYHILQTIDPNLAADLLGYIPK